MLQNALPIPHRLRSERRRFDGRSPTAVRIRALVRQYTAAVGDAASDPVMAAAIKRAAELQVLAEQARAAAVRNGTFDPIKLARIQNTADRAVRGLRLDQYASPDEDLGSTAAIDALFSDENGNGG